MSCRVGPTNGACFFGGRGVGFAHRAWVISGILPRTQHTHKSTTRGALAPPFLTTCCLLFSPPCAFISSRNTPSHSSATRARRAVSPSRLLGVVVVVYPLRVAEVAQDEDEREKKEQRASCRSEAAM